MGLVLVCGFCPPMGVLCLRLVGESCKEQAGMPLRSILRLALLRKDLRVNILAKLMLFICYPLD